jgi:hypothetical protein
MKNIIFNKLKINYKIEKEIAKLLLYVPYPYAEIDNKLMKTITNKYGVNKDLIKSMKKAYIQETILKNFHKIKNNMKQISKEYETENIIELSNKYNNSPLNILRIVMLNKKIDHKQFINMIKNNSFKNYDKTQFELGKKYDIYTIINDNEILKQSLNFEKEVENILIKNGVEYKTQEDLTQEQKGNVVCTPDFLILSDLKINGNIVKWIDAKNFYGANTNFIRNRILKQTKKYLDNYGDGCIVFKYGVCEKLQFKNITCVYLD